MTTTRAAAGWGNDERRRTGRPIGEADCQIASIARSRGAALVTRNVRDDRPRPRFKLELVTVRGHAPPNVDISDRGELHDFMDGT